ncbi:MAG TPA: M20/M25/M40 family metallo-hydrolase [Blastocatellia bacterium]|nr:M20/M25/M40 family metallo-hydrolase [Blastocatellia bacterium]HMX27455.1 M20/M25/M40 family metallo-hydrolase [Blastocatellia bacterium]HMY75597.1 M20/M25/M40 family metallo-hydrolase [Blastocatellia bacterium]HMZ17158.1 M20/M25/M40 family metallo-hydrolase [Blastocatellia bacterium]HNG30748.1 M20/M25/M40 family metallo-hydrolase [Blastocatellia bacterium]
MKLFLCRMSIAAMFIVCGLLPARAQTAEATIKRIFDLPKVKQALENLKAGEARAIQEQITICEIPAPSFQEERRAAWFKQRFTELGLKNVRIDKVGNVLGERPGKGNGPVLALAAHLDTVFPEGTDVRVKREGAILKGPGIGDDCRGLAVILAVARALEDAKIETDGTIIFVANVGEEGLGDLRGARHLFNEELKGRATHFISVDGVGAHITNVAVGVVRYRVTFHGPGGHSFGAFGLPSPIHAMGRAIEKISRFQVPKQPKTTFNVGKIEGGTSVNSIAHTAWMEVDMRSESAAELDKLETEFKRAVQAAVDEENRARPNKTPITTELKIVSQRPAGVQAEDSPIVQTALAAGAVLGIQARLTAGSTDSNIPISLKIPAVTIDGGGEGKGAHALDELFDTTNSHLGTQRALLIALGIVGVK